YRGARTMTFRPPLTLYLGMLLRPLPLLVAVILLASLMVDTATALTPEDRRQLSMPFYSEIIEEDCSTGTGGPANIHVDQGFSLGTDPQERRVNLVRALMNDFGLTAEQASGIVGNFMAESGGHHLPPDINEGTRSGAPPR